MNNNNLNNEIVANPVNDESLSPQMVAARQTIAEAAGLYEDCVENKKEDDLTVPEAVGVLLSNAVNDNGDEKDNAGIEGATFAVAADPVEITGILV